MASTVSSQHTFQELDIVEPVCFESLNILVQVELTQELCDGLQSVVGDRHFDLGLAELALDGGCFDFGLLFRSSNNFGWSSN